MSDNYEHLSTLMKNDIYKFEKLFFYDGYLGVNYSKNSSKFTIWEPLASKVFLLLYGKEGKDLKHKEYEIIKMNPGQNGSFIDANSVVSIKNKGKFLGFCEENTNITGSNTKTCLEHLKELEITHVHLLPIYDFASIDESKESQNNYNWGYDPQNYNALEGSYSLDPFNGEVRLKEFKTMVKTLHDRCSK